MPRNVRRSSCILSCVAYSLAFAGLIQTCGISFGQSLKFVPPIYNVPLSSSHLLNNPAGMAVDAHGTVYIVDTGHSQVWKIDAFEQTSLFAGTGSAAYTGDNGLAADAALNAPLAVTVDLAGNVFIADAGNHAVRRVDAVTGVITTFAGGNGNGDSGNNGLATAAELESPAGLAVDAADNLYIADAGDAQIRKVQTNGVILWYGGLGTPPTGNGDGGPATSAKFVTPGCLALDTAGDLYIADPGASDIRRITAAGIISTVAGSTKGNSGMGGPATSAQLNTPKGIALDSDGNLFITDSVTGLLTIVDSTGNINVVGGLAVFGGVGDGVPARIEQLLAPFGVAVDATGTVFLDSVTNDAVYKVMMHPDRFAATTVGQSSAQQRLIVMNMGTSTITVSGVASSGDFGVVATPTAANARPCNSTTWNALPTSAGNNYCTIDLTFTPTASGIRTGTATVTSNDTPATLTDGLTSIGMSPAVAVSDGAIYIVAGAYPGNLAVRNDNVPATTANLGVLGGFNFDGSGNLFVTETGFCDVRRVDANTGIISTVVGTVAGNCGYGGNGGPATSAQFYSPNAIVFGAEGTMYVSDSINYVIRDVDTSGTVHPYAGIFVIPHACPNADDGSQANAVPLCPASTLRFDSFGNMYFPEVLTNTIRKITSAGVLSTVAGTYTAANGYGGDGGAATSALLNQPSDIAFDSNNNLYFTDTGNQIVRRVDATTHIITTVAGTPKVQGFAGDGGLATEAKLNEPQGLDIDAAGNLYIADTDNNVIRKVDAATGIIHTIAGNFELGNLYNGEGVPATSAGLDLPTELRLDPYGNVVFTDNNTLVRKVSPNGLIDFGNQQVSVASTSHSLTVSNVGNTPLTFNSTTPYTIDGDFALAPGGSCDFTQPLAAGASCTVNIVFTPTTSYERYGTLNLHDNGIGSPQITELRGAGFTPNTTPQISVSPMTLSFASQIAGTTSAGQIVTVSNPGSTTAHITQVSIGGSNPGQFSNASTCGGVALASGQSCTITVAFAPTSAGGFSETISVIDDASGSPQVITASGTATAAAAGSLTIVPTVLTFGSQAIGTQSAPQLVTLTNTGTAPVNFTSLSSTGNYDQFSIGQTCVGAPLAVNKSCTINALLTPNKTGNFTVTMTIVDDAAGSPQSVTITGTGTPAPAPQAVLSPTAVSFPSQVAGTVSTQTMTLTNPGNATLAISGITITGSGAPAYSIVPGANQCGVNLNAAGNCSIVVQFAPQTSGSYNATLTVADNATGSPQTAAITGLSSLAPPDFAVAPTPATASVQAGSPAQFALTFSSTINGDPFSNAITLTASGVPAGWGASFAPPSVTPNSSGVGSSTLTITTPQNIASLSQERLPQPMQAGIFPCFLFVAGLAGWRARRKLPRSLLLIAVLLASGAVAVGLAGCGGGFAEPSTSRTAVITITAVSGSLQHSTQVTLTVNQE